MTEDSILELRAITKRFPGVAALQGVDFSLRPGEVHALLGENGAGKSTLIKILTGVQSADEGTIHVRGVLTDLRTPRAAQAAGITLVPQDILIVPQLSLGRNILIGGEQLTARRNRLSIDERELVRRALRQVDLALDPDTPASEMSVPQLRLAQIARALLHPGDIVVLDEPTAVLSEPDAEHLLSRLETLRGTGKGIIYVTHRLSEVARLADRATVLRDGRRVAAFNRSELSRDRLVRALSRPEAAPSSAGGGVATERVEDGAARSRERPPVLAGDKPVVLPLGPIRHPGRPGR